jgi:hypothetical protein
VVRHEQVFVPRVEVHDFARAMVESVVPGFRGLKKWKQLFRRVWDPLFRL